MSERRTEMTPVQRRARYRLIGILFTVAGILDVGLTLGGRSPLFAVGAACFFVAAAIFFVRAARTK